MFFLKQFQESCISWRWVVFVYEKPTVLHELSYILGEAMRKEEKLSLFITQWYCNWLNVRLAERIPNFPIRFQEWKHILISNPHQVRKVRGDSVSMNVLWSYFKKGLWVMWSCVKICVMLCYFKKAAWREEIEPSFFKKLCPLMEEKGKSFPTHLTYSVQGSLWCIFYHGYVIYSQCGLV